MLLTDIIVLCIEYGHHKWLPPFSHIELAIASLINDSGDKKNNKLNIANSNSQTIICYFNVLFT